jgi:RNA polymerase sigma-70 factor, ECF subfamily
MSTTPESELIARARTGDRAAQDELSRIHLPMLRGFLRRYAKNGEEHDLAHKALLRAFERLESFRGESGFRSWLMQLAKNVALNELRTVQPGTGMLASRELEEADLITRSLCTDRLVAREAKGRIARALSELPEKQQACVRLRIIEERSFAEIGELLGCSEETAKVNYHHGIKKVRAQLEEP